jgi:hypothetical protein
MARSKAPPQRPGTLARDQLQHRQAPGDARWVTSHRLKSQADWRIGDNQRRRGVNPEPTAEVRSGSVADPKRPIWLVPLSANYDQRIEDNHGQDGALRCRQMHNVQRLELRVERPRK